MPFTNSLSGFRAEGIHIDMNSFSLYKHIRQQLISVFTVKLKRRLSMPRPFIPLLLALMAGITCANLFPIPNLPVQICLVATLIMILLTLMRKWRRSLYPILLFSLFLLGILEMNVYLYPHPGKNHISNFHGFEKINVEGIICDDPQVSPETGIYRSFMSIREAETMSSVFSGET